MRKYMILIIGLSIIFNTGCKRSMSIRETLEESNRQYTRVYKLEKDISIYYTDKKEIFIDNGIKEQCINKDSASFPKLSPDGRRLAYISPHEFEALGELHIYDIEKNEETTVIKIGDIESQDMVKSVEWLDDRYLVTIIGYAYGTVSQGGNLYIYDMIDGKLTLILSPEEKRKEIKDFTIKYPEIIVDIAVHNEKFTDYTVEQKIIKIQDILDSIGGNL